MTHLHGIFLTALLLFTAALAQAQSAQDAVSRVMQLGGDQRQKILERQWRLDEPLLNGIVDRG